jgi:hypothetical protein
VLFGYGSGGTCDPSFSGVAANNLFAQQITITSAAKITALGVYGNNPGTGLQGSMGLYNNSGGLPGGLVVFTNAQAIGNGDNRIPVVSAQSVNPGTYWIAAEFNAIAKICGDGASSNNIEYVSVSFPGLPNPFGSTPNMVSSSDMYFYAVGAE